MHAGSTSAAGFRRRLGALALAAAAVCASAGARAETLLADLYDFQFEDGTVLPSLRIAFETRGTLSAARDNAVVLLHDALADRHAYDPWIGPGKLFDTDKYFVITADAVGGGESVSPGDGKGQDFPRYTIRDLMAADYALVTRRLGLGRLRAVVGRSMGAFVALEWAVQHPEMLQSVVMLAPSARSDANFQAVIDLMTGTVALDPDWDGGRYERNPVEGLRHAGMIYFPWSVSAAYLDRTDPAELARQSEAEATAFAAWDANALVLRLAACRGHDVAAGVDGGIDAALARAAMPVLLMDNARDRLIDPGATRLMRAALPHAVYAEIPGDLGHRAIAVPPGTPEGDFIERTIRAFLK
jgi:homoserine O-acetyltransferase/O-succinyltransferase